ncbi:hypothetical protein FO519_006824 [Halicephalobus sp. NKZ332]|nr:hypothetical protein FO519_006824 [Halicephalobus sp. NKZ332]
MKFFIFFIFPILFGISKTEFTCGLKTKTITKLQNGISDYLEDSQYSKLLGFIETDIMDGVNASKIFDNFVQYLLQSLTPQQTSEITLKGIVAGNQMKGMNLMQLLSELGEGLRENLEDFAEKLVKKAGDLKSQGKLDEEILKIGYKMVYNFVTKKKEGKIMCSIRSRFTDQQWEVIYNNFGVFIQTQWPLWVSGNLVKLLRYYNLISDGFYGGKDVREFVLAEVERIFTKNKFQEYYCRFVLDGIFVFEEDTVVANCYGNLPDDRGRRRMKILNDSIIEDFGDSWADQMLSAIRSLNFITLPASEVLQVQRNQKSSWPDCDSLNESIHSDIYRKFTTTSRPFFPSNSDKNDFPVFESPSRKSEEDLNPPTDPLPDSPREAQRMEDYDVGEEFVSQKSEDYAPYGVD